MVLEDTEKFNWESSDCVVKIVWSHGRVIDSVMVVSDVTRTTGENVWLPLLWILRGEAFIGMSAISMYVPGCCVLKTSDMIACLLAVLGRFHMIQMLLSLLCKVCWSDDETDVASG